MTINGAYLTIIIACLVTILFIVAFAPRVEAALTDVPICEAINTAGAITVYRCAPDSGAPFKINSLGFMLNED